VSTTTDGFISAMATVREKRSANYRAPRTHRGCLRAAAQELAKYDAERTSVLLRPMSKRIKSDGIASGMEFRFARTLNLLLDALDATDEETFGFPSDHDKFMAVTMTPIANALTSSFPVTSSIISYAIRQMLLEGERVGLDPALLMERFYSDDDLVLHPVGDGDDS